VAETELSPGCQVGVQAPARVLHARDASPRPVSAREGLPSLGLRHLVPSTTPNPLQRDKMGCCKGELQLSGRRRGFWLRYCLYRCPGSLLTLVPSLAAVKRHGVAIGQLEISAMSLRGEGLGATGSLRREQRDSPCSRQARRRSSSKGRRSRGGSRWTFQNQLKPLIPCAGKRVLGWGPGGGFPITVP